MKLLATLVITLFIYPAYGQVPVWNKELPITTQANLLQISLQSYGDQYLVANQKNIITLNRSGEITGAVLTPFYSPSYGFGGFIRPKTDVQTGEKYFLLATSKLVSSNALSIYEYRPGQGFVHETILDEAWGSAAFSPVFIDLNDSTYVILGRKYFRQITHRPGVGAIINWEKLNTLGNPNAGVKTADGIVGVSQNGVVFALDAVGNTLWADTTAYILRDVKMANNGFLAVGRTVDSLAVLINFSPAGTINWTKTYADDFLYNHLLLEADGSLLVTGQSASLSVLLQRLAADGTSIWRNTYQQGTGRSTLRLGDGYLVAGQFKQDTRSFVLRTDAAGHTQPVQTLLNPRRRKVENALLSAVAAPSATLFFDGEKNFLVPKDSLTSLFFAAAPWLGALDQDNVLHLSAEVYGIDSLTDYRSGFGLGPAADFDRVWWVSRAQIAALRHDWADNGIIDQPIPDDILTWPATGNNRFAYNLDFTSTTTDKALLPAPFVDANGDGLYSPADGDYPQIKGDQMAWWTITDSVIHTYTNGPGLLADIGVSMYVYDCSTTAQLDHSLFVDYKIINRSEHHFEQMFAGMWADPDLGCLNDDYVGTLPAANALYVYNQDNVDGEFPSSCLGIPFTGNIPIGSLSLINTTLNKSVYLNYISILPNEDHAFYQLLHGSVLPNGQPTDFFFTGNPADQDTNSMCANGGAAVAADYSFIGSHGPFSLAPNDTFQLTVAFTYHPNIPLPCPDVFGTVKNDLDQLRALTTSGALEAPPQLPPTVQLAPGQSTLLDASVPGATAYAWSNGAVTATTTVSAPGEYSVTITRTTGCATVETVLVTAATPTNDPAWIDHLRLFPNPSAGQFHIEIRGDAQAELEFTLLNVLGQVAQRQLADFSSGTLQRTFDYTRLPAGVYTLRLRAGEKTRFVKVVLQR